MTRISKILAGEPITNEVVARIQDRILFDRGNIADKYSWLFLLLALSSIIATAGIITDSTAVVIGGMMIAPLMTPMLAMSFSITSGDLRNSVRSLLITAAGVLLVVAIAAVVTVLSPTGVHLAGNSQVLARTEPRVMDLVIALAAGFVGAFAIARKDIGEILPGVAVSISIVPPLCVAGAAFAEGSFQLAFGALLLFAVNFFAIQLAGDVVFALLGFAKLAKNNTRTYAHRFGFAVAIIGTLVLAVPLIATSKQLVEEAALESQTKSTVATWLDGTEFESLSISIENKSLTVEITGEGTPPQTEDLVGLLADNAQHPTRVQVLVLPQELTYSSSYLSTSATVNSNETTEESSTSESEANTMDIANETDATTSSYEESVS